MTHPGEQYLAEQLQAAYDKVKEWPEYSETGFMDLLTLRNLVPGAIALLAAEKARADAAEAERDKIMAEALEWRSMQHAEKTRADAVLEALMPFGRIGDDGRGSALQDDAPLAVVNANMPDLPKWLASVRGVITQGDVRRARSTITEAIGHGKEGAQ